MVARVASASLGLLAFAVVATTGLLARNPIETTLSRCIFALVLFSVVGLVLGGLAQKVINEHVKKSESQIQERYEAVGTETDDSAATTEAAIGDGEPSAG